MLNFRTLCELSKFCQYRKAFCFNDKNDINDLVGKQVTRIHHLIGDKSMHVAIYLEVDATIIVRGWRILRYHNQIICGASPYHSL